MILIGTCHVDLDGPRKLRQALDFFQPKKIGVEIPSSPKKAVKKLDEIAAQIDDELRKTILPAGMKQFYAENAHNSMYEVREAVRYSKRTGAEVVAVDQPNRLFPYASAALTVEYFVGLWEREPDRRLARLPYRFFRDVHQSAMREIYETINDEREEAIDERTLLRMKENPFLQIQVELAELYKDPLKAERRESAMAKRVKKEKPDLVVVGANHLYENHIVPTLGERLGEDVTSKVLLGDIKIRHP